mmetsp:Transcript_7595/g.11072  ORF Transcript_7595/g.11072 Transcript_7595/m.11072 type:complete len:103 (+) Transcript_7595:681-989(+)
MVTQAPKHVRIITLPTKKPEQRQMYLPIEQRYASGDGHLLNIFITYIINLFDEGSDSVGVRNYNTFISRPEGRYDYRVEERHNSFGCIFQRFTTRPIKLFVG